MKKRFCFVLLFALLITTLFAKSKTYLSGKWKNDDFTLVFEDDTLQYSNKGAKDSVTFKIEQTDSFFKTVEILKIKSKDGITLNEKIGYQLKNGVSIPYSVNDKVLILDSSNGKVELKKDTTKETLLTVGGVAAGVVAGVAAVAGAVEYDSNHFSVSEFEESNKKALDFILK